MIRTSPAPATKVKTIEQQNADFTAEGSPPPGTAGTSIPLKAPPLDKSAVSAKTMRARKRATLGLPTQLVPTQLVPTSPPLRDDVIDIVGKVPSEPMKQASRDLKRGLVDTDRGAEAGRTYKKLKQTQ